MAIEPLYTVKDGVRLILESIRKEESLNIKTVNIELLKLNNHIRLRGYRDIELKDRLLIQQSLKAMENQFRELLLISHNLQAVQNRVSSEMMKWGMKEENTQ